MKHVQICGIMMMASNTDDEQQIAQEFDEAAQFFDEIKADILLLMMLSASVAGV